MTTVNKTAYETGVEVINGMAKEFTGKPAAQGVSYFKGKNRLCKILNSKKGIRIELNVTLPEILEKKYQMVSIDEATAKKKHLGTMKYLVVSLQDDKALKEVLTAALKSFKAIHEVEEPKETPKVNLEKAN